MQLGNLPVPLTSFVGRRHELAEVRRQVCVSRLVTLTGAGGCGKTRLALEAASGLGCAFAGGVWLVELASLSEPALVQQLVAGVLLVQSPPDQPVLASLLSRVRQDRMLLVLDNCEHLVGACAELAQALLLAAPDLSILVTSREPLGVTGEMLYPVLPLAWPPDPQLVRHKLGPSSELTPEAARSYDAIQLFVERAQAVLPGFALNPANTGAVVRICRRLDGIPLAIELASAHANVLTVHEIAERLDDRFEFLVSVHRATAIPRHRTLCEVIDWSYELLTTDEQRMLRRLGVFAGGFTLSTAEAVCLDPEAEGGARQTTLELLTALVNKSLVIASTLERSAARYGMLESVREYALEKLEQAGEAAGVRDRHLDLFLARAEEAAPSLGDAHQQIWLDWLENEHDNLRAALAWSLERGQPGLGLRIAVAIARFMEVRGHIPEAMTWFDRLLARASDTSISIQVQGHTFASFLAMLSGDAAASMSHARLAVDFAEAAEAEGDRTSLALALSGLAAALRMVGDNEAAYGVLDRVAKIYRDQASEFYLGMTLLAQGTVAITLGEHATARSLLEASLALARRAGDAFRVGHALNLLGELARCEHEYSEAVPAYQSGLEQLRAVGADRDVAAGLANLGFAYLHLGDTGRALESFSESMALHRAQHNELGAATTLIGFAAAAVERGLPTEAARLLAVFAARTGLRFMPEWPANRFEYDHYLALTRAALDEGEFRSAEDAGRIMSLEEAALYAQHLPLERLAAPQVSRDAHSLTEREREVASLIAQGLSNAEIASALVLSKRTVEKHIGNILSKLEMTRRAQVVRWAIEQGLAGPQPLLDGRQG